MSIESASAATSGSPTQLASYCRVCFNSCGIVVDVDPVDGRAVAIRGDKENPLSLGYTCVKGRAQSQLLYDDKRLRHSVKRAADGTYAPIPVQDALDEIAERIAGVLDRHGPAAIANYYGTMATTNCTTGAVLGAFMDAIGSPLRFSPNTIDKPGKMIAQSLHGSWMAPPYGYDRPGVVILFGLNPVIAYQGVPRGNPGAWIREARRAGTYLIVVDPRRTETARLADLHVQSPPGHDVEILACIIRTIIDEGLVDREFLDANVDGIEKLRMAVTGFSPEIVAASTGLDPEVLREIGHRFGRAPRGYVALGTGPNMSGPGVLLEYLALCLETLRGHWARSGDIVLTAPTLLAPRSYKAQANSPVRGYGLAPILEASGLASTSAGVPIAGLPAQIETPDEKSRVRVLISCGGNPASAWPDQRRVVRSLRSLELLVQIDPWMSATSRLADYVLAPKMPLEVPSTTQVPLDNMSMLGIGYGLAESYAQYTPAIVGPPPDSDLLEEWEMYWGLADRLHLPITVRRQSVAPIEPFSIGPDKPTTDELLELLTRGSRVSLESVKAAPHGHNYVDENLRVKGADPGWEGRLDIGNKEMMLALTQHLSTADAGAPDVLRLIPRRIQQVYNSSIQHEVTLRGRPYNPAYIHPVELERRGLENGDVIEIESSAGMITAFVLGDDDLLPGVVSITHCFGLLPEEGDDPQQGSNTSRLVDLNVMQPYSGQPVMSNIAVTITKSSSAAKKISSVE